MENQQQPTKSTNPTMWIILIVIILVIAGIGIYVYISGNTNENTNTAANTNKSTNENVNVVSNTNTAQNANTATNTNIDTSEWKTYENTVLGFSLQYPADWTLVEASSSGDSLGQVISIQSPETAEMLQNGLIDFGYSKDVVVSFWSSINNEYARGGSWVGQREYSGLADYFTDENAPKEKVGIITVDGLPAYEVSIGGAGLAYGVMVENSGIYEISFPTAWGKTQLSTTQQMILSTFLFIE